MINNTEFQPRWERMVRYNDEATYEKIQRHLSDINDLITEDDIRNVKIAPLPTTQNTEKDFQKPARKV